MATFEFKTPQGTFQIRAPDEQSAIAALRRQLGQQQDPARVEPNLTPAQRNAVSSMAMANPNPPSQGGVTEQPRPPSPIDMEAPPIQINGQWHPAGTTPDMVAHMPAGFMYDPSTGQYRNPQEDAARADRSRLDAAIGGGMQGVSLGAGDEILAAASALTGGPAQGALRAEQVRATLEQDRENYPGTAIVSEILGGFLLPGATYKAGAGFLRNVARAAGVGAGMGGAYAYNTGEGGIADRISRVPAGAAIGAIGGAIATPVAMALGKLGNSVGNFIRDRRLYNNGQLTPAGVSLLQRMGVDPTDINDNFQREFARQAARLVDPNDARVAAEMGEFGIPALRPNVTGDPNDFAALERTRQIGQGNAGETVRQAIARQEEAMRRGADTIAENLSGGLRFGQNEAAAAVMTGLRSAQESARRTAGAAYDALEAAGGGLRGTAVANLADDINARLNAMGRRLSDQLTPNARAAIDEIRQMTQGAERGSVPFMDIERIRQNLVQLRNAAARGSLGQDNFAIQELIRVFDNRVDDLMTTAMTEGDPTVIQALAQNARGLWSQYRQTFLGDGAGAKFIQRMVDEDASPDQAVRWLFSAGKLGSSNFTASIARQVRSVLGETSDEWNAIRQAAFRQLVSRAADTPQPGPQQIRSAINEFINGPLTKDLSRTLFSDQERALMARFASAVGRMVPPTRSVNVSGTAYENARLVRQVWQALSGALGFAASGGNPGAAVVATGAVQGLQNMATNAATRALVQPGPQRVIQSIPVAPAAAGLNALALPIVQPAAEGLTSLLFPSPQG